MSRNSLFDSLTPLRDLLIRLLLAGPRLAVLALLIINILFFPLQTVVAYAALVAFLALAAGTEAWVTRSTPRSGPHRARAGSSIMLRVLITPSPPGITDRPCGDGA